MHFEPAEKLAIIRMIHSLILADNVVHPQEISELQHLMKQLDFDTSEIQFSGNLEMRQCLDIVAKLSQSKKKALILILENLAKCDGQFHDKEKLMLQQVFDLTEIGDKTLKA